MPSITFSGSGTLVWSGGDMRLGGGGNTNIAMTGGTIDIASGYISNSDHAVNWTANKASLNVAAGTSVDLQGNDIYVDAVTGAGSAHQQLWRAPLVFPRRQQRLGHLLGKHQ